MNGGTIRGTALSMDGTASPWTGGYHEWVTTNHSSQRWDVVLKKICIWEIVHIRSLALEIERINQVNQEVLEASKVTCSMPTRNQTEPIVSAFF